MLKQKPSLWLAVATLTIAAFAMSLTGCDSSSPSDDETTSATATVAVTATPATIATGGYTVVEAIVEANDVGLADQEVTFTVSPAGSGSCTPAVDITDADGVAATMFTASATGSVSITATVSGSNTSGTAWVTVAEEGQTGSGTVSLTVSPSLLFADGEDTARVTVVVSDVNGNPAPDNTLVKICAGEKFVDLDGNGYWSEGIDSLVYDNNSNDQWDAVGSVPSTAYTGGGNGTASVDFVSGTRAGTYYIKATVDEGGIQGSAEQSVQLNPSTELHSIFLAAEEISIAVSQTGGIETADLYATGYDVNGNTVPEGLSITFTILSGPDGGEYLGDDPLVTEVVAFTSSQGTATVPIHSGFVSGTVRIRAFANTVLSNATQIMICSGPPKYIVVGAGEDCNYQYWNIVNERVDIVAVVSDTFLNPCSDSTVVYFSCDEGTMKAYEGRIQNMDGVAETEWISGNNVDTADGIVWVFAETGGGTVRDSVAFFNTSPLVYAYAVPDSIDLYADGKSSAGIWISGEDINNNPVINGTTIEFDVDWVDIETAVLEDGCVGAYDLVKVKSAEVLERDYSLTGGDDDGVGAVVYIIGDLGPWGGISTMITVVLHTGYSYLENCEITCETDVAPNTPVYVSATIQDRWGNPLGDHTLVMEASGGDVENGTETQVTNTYGEASGFIFNAPGAAETVTLTVTDTDPMGGIFITTSVNVE
jgi:hypothetical protein